MASADSHRTLQNIWDSLSRAEPGGKKWILLKGRDDLVYLYCTGFVDEGRHTLAEWVAVFEDSLQENGTYLVDELRWMDKARYHYSGPTGSPFDPASLREGEWSETEIDELIRKKILPAVYFTAEEFGRIWKEASPTFRKNGKYLIGPGVKKDLKDLVDLYPSPAQVRALGVAEARQAAKAPAAGSGRGTPGSGFAQGPTPSEIAAQRLADILGKTGGKR